MSLAPTDVAAAARSLFEARRDRAPIAPLRVTHPDLDVAGAYAIQQAYVARLQEAGAGQVVGYKLGLTSAPMRQLLGVDEPDYGPVLAGMVHPHGVELAVDDFVAPRIEAEIALVLDAPLAGPGVSSVQAARAVGGAVAALELVDSRIAEWDIRLVDTVADLASSAAIVLSSRVVALRDVEPRLTGMVIRRNGEIRGTGAGAAALGDPVAAIAWLANTLAPHGVTLQPGHVIMTGSLHAAFDVAAGDRVRADFAHLGPVGCHFV